MPLKVMIQISLKIGHAHFDCAMCKVTMTVEFTLFKLCNLYSPVIFMPLTGGYFNRFPIMKTH